MTDVNSRAPPKPKSGPCMNKWQLPRVGGENVVGGQISYLTCALPANDWRDGNRVVFKTVNDGLQILKVVENYCVPLEEQCRCNTLLDRMFADHVNVPAINRIDTRFITMEGCICFLSASARVGFNFVKMTGTKPECTERKEIDTQFLPNFNVCQSYMDNGCNNQPITITKI